MTLGPAVRDGEHVFGVAHIFASFNDTFIVSVKSIRSLTLFCSKLLVMIIIDFICMLETAACDWSVRQRNPCPYHWLVIFSSFRIKVHQNFSMLWLIKDVGIVCVVLTYSLREWTFLSSGQNAHTAFIECYCMCELIISILTRKNENFRHKPYVQFHSITSLVCWFLVAICHLLSIWFSSNSLILQSWLMLELLVFLACIWD